MACKKCGGSKILIHKSFVGEELCYSCLQKVVKLQEEPTEKKQLEIVPVKALNPDLTGAPQIMGE